MDERIRMSRKQERDGAQRYGGSVNSRSGAGYVRKNDVRTPAESVEFKGTKSGSYRLVAGDLIKAWHHATVESRKMVFGIEFFPTAANQYSPGMPRRYVIQTEDDYLAMREELASAINQLEFLGELAEDNLRAQ